tara:strand:+ start:2078 stop:2614 length:537 start_codon:yes stop_codon:yes gene_type:complete
MNINNIYIDGEIINIFFYLLNFDDKVNFTKTNKELFVLYKDKVRNEIFRYINHDYLLFHECLKRFKYTEEEKIKLIERSLDINSVLNVSGRFCDLRFIFELCYYSRNYFYKNIYKKDRLKGKDILSLMIQEICNSISFNRFETLLNIEGKMILYSLKRSFKPILWKTNEPQWIYLVGD